MEQNAVLSAAEAAEYGEFKRFRRETEISLTLKKLVLDASGRETDKHVLRAVCESAKRLGAACVLVSPVNASAARRILEGSGIPFCCIVGGTGESITAVKKTEAKKAVKQGAGEIRLVPCYSALVGGNLSYLKREIKRVKRAVKKRPLTVSLEDRSLSAEQVAFGVRAACDGKADAVCVRGDTALVLRAQKAGAGRVFADVSYVENAEQLRLLVKAGARRAVTVRGERIAEELYKGLSEEPPLITITEERTETEEVPRD